MKFEELEVWKRSARLSAEIYKFGKNLDDWGFRDQLGRAGLSIPSNIAEGFERKSNRECVNFLSYAKGSCGELRTQIYVGMEVGYIPNDLGKAWIQETQEISLMLGGLMQARKNFT